MPCTGLVSCAGTAAAEDLAGDDWCGVVVGPAGEETISARTSRSSMTTC